MKFNCFQWCKSASEWKTSLQSFCKWRLIHSTGWSCYSAVSGQEFSPDEGLLGMVLKQSSYVEVLNYYEKPQTVMLDGWLFPIFWYHKNYLHFCKKLPQPTSLSCLSRCFLCSAVEERDDIWVEGLDILGGRERDTGMPCVNLWSIRILPSWNKTKRYGSNPKFSQNFGERLCVWDLGQFAFCSIGKSPLFFSGLIFILLSFSFLFPVLYLFLTFFPPTPTHNQPLLESGAFSVITI